MLHTYVYVCVCVCVCVWFATQSCYFPAMNAALELIKIVYKAKARGREQMTCEGRV